MDETLNWDFVNNLGLYFRPSLLKPDYRVEGTFADIDFERLIGERIIGIAIDADNTIGPYQANYVDSRVAQKFNEMRKRFNGKMVVVSNTNTARRANLERYFGVQSVNYSKRKPHLEPFYEALNLLGTRAEQTAMIGDRICTDIVGGNRAGFYTVLVEPLEPSSEPFPIRVGRRLESALYEFICK